MLVVEKKHHIKAIVNGENTEALIKAIRTSLPEAKFFKEIPDEYLDHDLVRAEGKSLRSKTTPGEMLRFSRQDAGLTQKQLAKLARVGDRAAIALMESGKRPISDKMARRLASQLMTSPEIFSKSFYPQFSEVSA